MNVVKRALLFIAVALIVLFFIVAFNQIIALYNFLVQFDAFFARLVATVVAVLFLLLLTLPIISYLRYPKMLELPKDHDSEMYRAFQQRQLARLKKNKALKAIDFDFTGESDEQILERAFAELKVISFKTIKRDANAVFLTTAISQNGILDGATVLVSLIKMVYNVTMTYENRPSFTRLIYLYAQIASVVLIARSIEDLDIIEEQLEPILTSLLGGSVVSLVPGAVNVTTLVVNSIVEGSVNALLTLRVGVITQRYLSAMTAVDKKVIRRGSALEAAGHLSSIIANNAKFIVKSFSRATKKATVDKIKWPW